MLNRKKHGFTVVELVIVIAIVAILAAVLIPTFIGIVNSAKMSADTTLIRNLNTALKMDKPNEKHVNMSEALAAVEKNGYDVGKINASKTGNEILWDSVNDCFVYLKKNTDGSEELIYAPESKNPEKPEKYQCWVIASEPNKNYSTYLDNYKGKKNVTVPDGVGLDVGTAKNITSVSYKSDSDHDVVFNTKGGTLTVNAKNATVKHYGVADKVTISAVKNESYHEFGQAIVIEITAGRVVVEDSAIVTAVIAKNDKVKIKVPENSNIGVYAPPATEVSGTTIKGKPEDVNATILVAGKKYFTAGFGTEADPFLIETCEQALNMEKTKGGYFKLVADIVVTDEIYLSGKTVVFDLNGHTLKLEYADGVKPNNGSVLYIGGKNGKLTINDSSEAKTGAVIGSDKTYTNKVTSAVRAGNYGKLIINGGHFYGMSEGTSCIFVMTSMNSDNKATVTINGGTFETASSSNGTYFVLNHQDNATGGCTITVNGGRFKNYNPGVTVVDPVNAKTGKIVLGTGCSTTEEKDGSDTWYVVSK